MNHPQTTLFQLLANTAYRAAELAKEYRNLPTATTCPGCKLLHPATRAALLTTADSALTTLELMKAHNTVPGACTHTPGGKP